MNKYKDALLRPHIVHMKYHKMCDVLEVEPLSEILSRSPKF